MLIYRRLTFPSLSHVVWEHDPWGDYRSPGNGGSLRDFTLTPPFLLIYFYIVGFGIVGFVGCVCVCVLSLDVLGVQFVLGGGCRVRGWGLRGVCRHWDGAIQVAVAVTGSCVWTVLTLASLWMLWTSWWTAESC